MGSSPSSSFLQTKLFAHLRVCFLGIANLSCILILFYYLDVDPILAFLSSPFWERAVKSSSGNMECHGILHHCFDLTQVSFDGTTSIIMSWNESFYVLNSSSFTIHSLKFKCAFTNPNHCSFNSSKVVYRHTQNQHIT